MMRNTIQAEPTVAPELIKEQLVRLRTSPQFTHSRRYPVFLDYVVLKTISGHPDDLKERTIGIEAFGRSPEYDLSADPIVRVTAGEVRKRLAQYYYEPEHHSELRIELRPGSYVPEFRFAAAKADAEVSSLPASPEVVTSSAELPLPVEPELSREKTTPAKRRILWSVAAMVMLSVAVWTALQIHGTSPYDQLWRPVAGSAGPVLISVGSVVVLNPPAYPSGPTRASVGLHPLFADPVALADTIAISNIQQVLFHYAKATTIQTSTATSYSDLQKGPVILISGFDNPWTMQLTDPLRYHFVQTAVDVYTIADRTDPVHGGWAINTRTAFNQVNHDYGLVARFHDPTTEQIVIVAAGIGENGTIAASELLSDARYLAE